ncbi:MAG: hypothetical protein AB7F78_19425 [Hyphomicrobiaceae bacterium]
MEWNALTAFSRKPANDKEAVSKGISGIIVSRALQDPYSAFERVFHSARVSPAGSNWGILNEPSYDKILQQAALTFDAAQQDAMLRKMHELAVDNAEWIWVTHDVNPRAISPKVEGFVQAKSWFQDLTPITLKK